MKKDNNLLNNIYDGQSVRPSLFQTLEKVKAQIDYEDFYNQRIRNIDPVVGEISLIIAELLLLNPEHEIRIGGNMMGVSLVQEVYHMLTHSHVELVTENFKNITDKIYNKKSYLRTALYNSVFELDAHYTNQVNHDFYQ